MNKLAKLIENSKSIMDVYISLSVEILCKF